MQQVTYFIRSPGGRNIFSFDNETRARRERDKMQQRVAGRLVLVRATTVEEVMQ